MTRRETPQTEAKATAPQRPKVEEILAKLAGIVDEQQAESKGAARVLNKVKQFSLYLGEDESLMTSAFQKDHSQYCVKKKKKRIVERFEAISPGGF